MTKNRVLKLFDAMAKQVLYGSLEGTVTVKDGEITTVVFRIAKTRRYHNGNTIFRSKNGA